MGADRGIHVVHDGEVEPLAVAKMLKAIVEKEQPGIVILGKQAIDDDCNQTGQMLSALLGWSQATFASKIEIGDGALTVRSEEHTSELQSLMRISYAVFCLKKKKKKLEPTRTQRHITQK